MRLVNVPCRSAVRQCLSNYHTNCRTLPGVADSDHFESLLQQVFDSIRRIEYVFALQRRDVSPERADPNSNAFDPIRAAILHSQQGNLDEACWLAFLSTHFGKHLRDGWKLMRSVYGACGTGQWDWNSIQSNPAQFVSWLSSNQSNLNGSFGNHRKYLTLKPEARAGTSAAFLSYIKWIQSYSSHAALRDHFKVQTGGQPGALFDAVYRSMATVKSFGRTGRFDYLTMLGKLNLFPMEPQSPYIAGSTGPRRGAALLLTGSTSSKSNAKDLEREVQKIGRSLSSVGVRFSMQVLEDALCNWQKSPAKYKSFRG